MSKKNHPVIEASDAVAASLDADVMFINGPIYRPLDQLVINMTRKRHKRKNLFLILVTEGGDADAAFRIARSFQNGYTRVVIFVTGYCKSAGTLIALGANELVMSDSGELGPLDVQVSKPDELLETQSGLTATSALTTLHDQAFTAFEYFFLQTVARSGNRISTRTATQIASQLACGLFSPIYEHVDPMHIGEAGRALLIAQRYGELLQAKSGNFTNETLGELASEYPSHGFVIDRTEAERLFEQVREPSEAEDTLATRLGNTALTAFTSADQRLVTYLSTELSEETHDAQNPSTSALADEPAESEPAGESEAPTPANVAEIRQIIAKKAGRGSREA